MGMYGKPCSLELLEETSSLCNLQRYTLGIHSTLGMNQLKDVTLESPFRRTGCSPKRTGTLTWTGPSGTPARRWSPIRLLGLPLYSSSAGFATERMASLSWSVQWHVSSWRTIITTLSKIHPRPGTPLRCLSEHWGYGVLQYSEQSPVKCL